MPMAPNPASPMAHSHLSTESTEGRFVPTFHNVEGEISNVSNQGCSGDSTIHFVEVDGRVIKTLYVLHIKMKFLTSKHC